MEASGTRERNWVRKWRIGKTSFGQYIEKSCGCDRVEDREATIKCGLSSFVLAWSWLCRTCSVHIYIRKFAPGRQGYILLILIFSLYPGEVLAVRFMKS